MTQEKLNHGNKVKKDKIMHSTRRQDMGEKDSIDRFKKVSKVPKVYFQGFNSAFYTLVGRHEHILSPKLKQFYNNCHTYGKCLFLSKAKHFQVISNILHTFNKYRRVIYV